MSKPGINDLFQAFQNFQRHSVRLVSAGAPVTETPRVEFAAEIVAAQVEFKARMEQLGLADHIDWSDWEGEDPA